MKKTLQVPVEDRVVHLAADIVYAQRQEWCEAKYRQLHLSFMKPRCHYLYDERRTYPLLIWLCGGSFAEVDRNVWMPEMVYFAKRGYAVAAVEYSTIQLVRFPDQLEDIKEAIRYLRAHAEELQIQPDHIGIMGESAGGYMSLLVALKGKDRTCDKGAYLDQSSEVQAVCSWYPVTDMSIMDREHLEEAHCAPDVLRLPTLMDFVTPDLPPFLMMHGTSDVLVGHQHSEKLYEALQKAGVQSDLYLIEGADHADHRFVQDQVKAIMLSFFDSVLKA